MPATVAISSLPATRSRSPPISLSTPPARGLGSYANGSSGACRPTPVFPFTPLPSPPSLFLQGVSRPATRSWSPTAPPIGVGSAPPSPTPPLLGNGPPSLPFWALCPPLPPAAPQLQRPPHSLLQRPSRSPLGPPRSPQCLCLPSPLPSAPMRSQTTWPSPLIPSRRFSLRWHFSTRSLPFPGSASTRTRAVSFVRWVPLPILLSSSPCVP